MLSPIRPEVLTEVDTSKFVLNKQCLNDWKQYFQNISPFVYKDPSDTDYIIVSGRLTCVLSYSMFSILQYQKPRTVYIVAPLNVCDSMRTPENVFCVDESKWIDGLSTEIFLSYIEKRIPSIGGRKYWYWQQMLKLGTGFKANISDDFVVVDADVIYQQTIRYKDSSGKYIFFDGGHVFHEYTKTAEALLGHPIHLSTDGSSFVAHTMIMNRPTLRSILKGTWWKKIVDEVVTQQEIEMGFSEYTFYSSAFMEKYPTNFIVKKPYFVRDREIRNLVTNNFCPTSHSIQRLKKSWRVWLEQIYMRIISTDSESYRGPLYIVWELGHALNINSKSNEPYPPCIDKAK